MAVINLQQDSTYSALVVETYPPFYSSGPSTPSPYTPASNLLYYFYPDQNPTRVYPFNNSSKFPVSFDLRQKPFVAFIASRGEIVFAEQNRFYQPPSQGLPSGRIGFFGPVPYHVTFNHPYYPNLIFFGRWPSKFFQLSIPFNVDTNTALFSVKIVYKNNTDQLLFLFTCNNSGYSTTPQFTASYIINRPSDFPLTFYPEVTFWRGHYFAVNY